MPRFAPPQGPAKRAAALVFAVAAFFAALMAPLSASAQELDDVDITFYAYVAEDESTLMLLGELEPDDPRLAAEIVSPQYGDDFFEGFGAFSDYEITDALRDSEIDQIDEADEYLVYEGDLEFEDGVELPGYVIFLSTDERVFVIIGFEDDQSDLFDLAEEAIEEGEAPRSFDDYEREELDF